MGMARADEPTALRELLSAGSCTQVRIELKAEGLFRPGLTSGAHQAEATMPKPLALTYRPGWFSPSGCWLQGLRRGGTRASRPQSGSAIGRWSRVQRQGGSMGFSGGCRDQWGGQAHGERLASRAVAACGRARRSRGAVVVVSPAGPMTRSELELVQGLGDPLTLADFLPPEPVAKGMSWKLPESAVDLSLRLRHPESPVRLRARSSSSTRRRRGSGSRARFKALRSGGAGTITCEGFLNFDREAGLVDRLEVNRVESRQARAGGGGPRRQEHADGRPTGRPDRARAG